MVNWIAIKSFLYARCSLVNLINLLLIDNDVVVLAHTNYYTLGAAQCPRNATCLTCAPKGEIVCPRLRAELRKTLIRFA